MCSTAQVSNALLDTAMVLVVMGVSGCGKSTVASSLANALGWTFIEGDAFHPPENVQRMAQGIALTDTDRVLWLDRLAKELAHQSSQGTGVVLACSALKKSYRDVLRRGCPDAFFVHLDGPAELIRQRLSERKGHYMPSSLLQSQFATLEPPVQPELAWRYEVTLAPQAIVDDLLRRLSKGLATPRV
jgi:gluconokinase